MSRFARPVLLGVLVAAGVAWSGGASVAAADEPVWEVLVPAARLGRFELRVERAELAGSLADAASRVAAQWDADGWPLLGTHSAGGPGLSRLTPEGIEAVRFKVVSSGRVRAERTRLAWRNAGEPGRDRAMPSFTAALAELGPPESGQEGHDHGTRYQTLVWLLAGEVGVVARRLEQAAARGGFATVMRFDAPADARPVLRGSRALAFAGGAGTAMVTLLPHPRGVAVIVHSQERDS